jgi:hypothetical protein
MTARRKIIGRLGVALAWSLAALPGDPAPVCAQTTTNPPRTSPNLAPKPGALGAMSSPERFLVTSAANERGTFLWVIDAVAHTVTLCEKAADATEFTCRKKALP